MNISEALLLESEAGTLVELDLNADVTTKLSQMFNDVALKQGVYPYGANIDINHLNAASGTSTKVSVDVAVTRSSQSGLLNITSSHLLGRKRLYSYSQAAAGALGPEQVYRYPHQ
jgi:hypothetical protein